MLAWHMWYNITRKKHVSFTQKQFCYFSVPGVTNHVEDHLIYINFVDCKTVYLGWIDLNLPTTSCDVFILSLIDAKHSFCSGQCRWTAKTCHCNSLRHSSVRWQHGRTPSTSFIHCICVVCTLKTCSTWYCLGGSP